MPAPRRALPRKSTWAGMPRGRIRAHWSACWYYCAWSQNLRPLGCQASSGQTRRRRGRLRGWPQQALSLWAGGPNGIGDEKGGAPEFKEIQKLKTESEQRSGNHLWRGCTTELRRLRSTQRELRPLPYCSLFRFKSLSAPCFCLYPTSLFLVTNAYNQPPSRAFLDNM